MAEGGGDNTDMGNRDPTRTLQVVIPSLPPLNKLPQASPVTAGRVAKW